MFYYLPSQGIKTSFLLKQSSSSSKYSLHLDNIFIQKMFLVNTSILINTTGHCQSNK